MIWVVARRLFTAVSKKSLIVSSWIQLHCKSVGFSTSLNLFRSLTKDMINTNSDVK